MPRTSRILLLLILAMATILRIWRIDGIPPGFHFDEAFEGLEAWRILTEPGYRPVFLAGNFGVPPLNAYANALMFGLAQALGGEAGPTAMRLTAALFGVAGVLAIYLLAAEMRRHEPDLPPALPLLSAASLALMRWHIHFSRIGIEPILVPLLWAGSAWLMLRGWRTGGWLSFLGAGVLMAAAAYTYQGAWVIPLLMVVLILHLAAGDRSRLAARWQPLVAAFGLALVLTLPLAHFFWQNPALLLLRPDQIDAFDQASASAPASLATNAWRTLRLFGPGQTGDLDVRRNLPGESVLNLWQAAPFYLGLGLALWRVRRPVYALPVTGLVGLLLPGALSDQAPHFHRVLGAAAPAALLAGLGLAWLWQQASLRWRPGAARNWVRWALQGAVVVVLLAGGLVAARGYFVRWASQPSLYYAFDAGLWDVGQWVADQPADQPIYLTPRAADHPTLAFAWRAGSGSRPAPVSFDGRHIFPMAVAAPSQAEHYVAIEHEDFRTQLLLPELFPDATIGPDFVDRAGQVYARVYNRLAGVKSLRAPPQPLSTFLGDGIRLEGYELLPDAPAPGGMLYVRLYWLVDALPEGDWTVFVHLLGQAKSDGSRLWAGRDSPPGNGSLPTGRWQPGWRVIDEFALQLPVDLPAGVYDLEIGMYQGDGAHLPAGGGSVHLGAVAIPAPEAAP